MDVVILAAGKGSRLGSRAQDVPKLFLEVNGQSIFKYQLNALAPLVESDQINPTINIVLGYGFYDRSDYQSKLDRYVRVDSRFEYNVTLLEDWESAENAASALSGVRSLSGNDDILLLCGDIITTPNQMELFVRSFKNECNNPPYSAVAAIEGWQDQMTSVRWDDSDVITDYGAIEGHQEAGMFILNREHLTTACRIWEDNSDEWFPTVFPEVTSKVIRIDPAEQIEINTQEHLDSAEEALPFNG